MNGKKMAQFQWRNLTRASPRFFLWVQLSSITERSIDYAGNYLFEAKIANGWRKSDQSLNILHLKLLN